MWITNYNWVKTIDNNVKISYMNEGFQHLRYNYSLKKKRWKLEAFVQYQYNKVMNLKERDLLGGGLRFKIMPMNYVGSGFMYERNLTYTGINVNYIKSNTYISLCAFVSNNIKFSNTTYFQFNLLNTKYRVYNILEATVNIYKRISYKMSFIVQYDNDHIYNSPMLTYNTVHKISITF